MSKKIITNRIFLFALLAFMLFSHVTQPTLSKYVYTATGRAMSSLISGNVFTDAFVLTNDSFVQTNPDSSITILNEKTSQNLHGVGLTEVDGILTIPADAPTDSFDLDSTSQLSFVVQNNSDYDLVACFDIILCMGWINNSELTCTITAPSSSETETNKTNLTVTASLNNNNQNSDITLNHHAEKNGSGGNALPVVDVQITGLFNANYSAYSMQIDPTKFLVDQNGDGDVLDDNELTQQEFNSFILVRSGETKTFEFNIDADQNIIGQWLSKNCYASISMTVKKYPQ